MTTIAVVDIETDRFEGEEGEAKVVELACVAITDEWDINTTSWEIGFEGSCLFKSDAAITPRARAMHHLSDLDVMLHAQFDCELWERCIDLEGIDYLAAHNVAFDRTVIERAAGPTDKPWICTLKCARVAWPEAPAFGNQVLRYWRGIEKVVEPPSLYPHCALYDATVTSWLLVELVDAFGGDLDRMVQVSSEPSLLPRITFGKHRGVRWSEAPRDYLQWVLKQDFDEDTRWTAKYWLEKIR